MLRTAIASAPRSSGGLLRPTRSLGSLRSAAAAQQQQQTQSSTIVPPVPSRNLVSSVLLSRDAYDRHNVNQLKMELKTRGLASSGRRVELVTRLLNDDAKRSGSGLVLDNVAAQESPKLRRGKASLASLRGKDGNKYAPESTSATPTLKTPNNPSSNPPSHSKSSAPTAPASSSPKTEASTATPLQSGPIIGDGPIVGDGATIPPPPGLEPGDAVSPSLEVADGAVKAPAKLGPASAGPPGVPPQDEPDHHPETFRVNIPYEEAQELPGPEIPIYTMYTNRPTESHRDHPEPAPIISPKAVSVSAAVEVSHTLEADVSDLIGSEKESAAKDATKAVKSEAGGVLKTIDGLRTSASEATTSVIEDIKSAVTSSTGSDPSKAKETVIQSLSLEGKADKKEDGQRSLNGEEKRGLYVLGGLIFGGFLAGGLGKRKKEKKAEKH